MKMHSVERIIAIAASALIAMGCTAPASAADNRIPVLKIEQVTIQNGGDTVPEDIEIAVTISNNSEGFRATSFGIVHDPSLGLTKVECDNDAGLAHSYGANGETGLIWFSGATGTPQKTANTGSAETMFTLHFALPENAAPGATYPISFKWDASDGSTAYWYLPDRTNVIGDIKACALGGGISLSDPNAPKLDNTSLTLSVEDSTVLSVLNTEDKITWISDNPAIATVQGGKVTAVSPGSCKIYALVDNTSLTCSVLVTKDATYDITNTEIIYIRNKDKKVSLRCPNLLDTNAIIWLSDNMEVVTVEKGDLTAIANGAASVFAIYGGIIYEAFVIVELPETPEEPEIIYGDVNLDGNVDILDCIVLNRSLLGASRLNDIQQLAADIYQDERISAMDSLCILKYVLELVSAVPVKP